MGHMRLGGALPRTRRWKEVVDLVGAGGSAASVASAALDAIDQDLTGAANDPALVHSVWLLTQLPDAARSKGFAEALRGLGLAVSDSPSTAELASAFSAAVDRQVETRKTRSDVGEMAQHAAVEALSGLLREKSSSLFGTTPDDVKRELGKIATEKQFGQLARDFFARFTQRCLTYVVSRELPVHVGQDQRFGNVAEQQNFAAALELHCKQASKIVETFAGGWWSKARFEKDLSEDRTARFVGYALKKIKDELRRGATE